MLNPRPTSPELHVNLDALIANYSWFCAQAPNSKTGVALKANAYGIGVNAVGPALLEAGCTVFFVAHISEGVRLRRLLGSAPLIYVLHGAATGEVEVMLAHRLYPVLNSRPQIALWRNDGAGAPAALHVDTGMNRTGLPFAELPETKFDELNLQMIMSHLACAATPEHPLNEIQRDRFLQVTRQFPGIAASFCNSAGVLLGDEYHFDLTRIGIGLFGASPLHASLPPPPLTPVVRIQAPIIQLKTVSKSETVGYGGTFCAPGAMQIAILAYGYADGLPRSVEAKSFGWVGKTPTPVLGRVSMDLTVVDVSQVKKPLEIGDHIEFLGPDLDAFAQSCNGEAYEILTSISPRVKRVYKREAS